MEYMAAPAPQKEPSPPRALGFLDWPALPFLLGGEGMG